MSACMCCRQTIDKGVSLGGSALHVCNGCWSRMTPAEQANLQAAMWHYSALAALNTTLDNTRVEINLFRVVMEEFIDDCRQAYQESQDDTQLRFPWERDSEN